MARRTDESCEEKSEFAHGCCVAAVHGIYAWHTTQNPSAICWQISTMAVQWQYNGGNGSVMAVQLKFVFASYSHRIGTIWHYIGTILALYWHSWVVMAVQYRPLRSPPSGLAVGLGCVPIFLGFVLGLCTRFLWLLLLPFCGCGPIWLLPGSSLILLFQKIFLACWPGARFDFFHYLAWAHLWVRCRSMTRAALCAVRLRWGLTLTHVVVQGSG